MPNALVTLYGRPGCHLCEEARAALIALRADGLPFELRELDIDRDPELRRRYLERIPVIELNGRIVSELGLDADELRAGLGTVSA